MYLVSAIEYSSSALDILAVTLHEVGFTDSGNNNTSDDYKSFHQLIQGEFCFERALEVPNSATIYAQFEKGSRVLLEPSAGGNYGHVCTQSGKPGVWKRYSVIVA